MPENEGVSMWKAVLYTVVLAVVTWYMLPSMKQPKRATGEGKKTTGAEPTKNPVSTETILQLEKILDERGITDVHSKLTAFTKYTGRRDLVYRAVLNHAKTTSIFYDKVKLINWQVGDWNQIEVLNKMMFESPPIHKLDTDGVLDHILDLLKENKTIDALFFTEIFSYMYISKGQTREAVVGLQLSFKIHHLVVEKMTLIDSTRFNPIVQHVVIPLLRELLAAMQNIKIIDYEVRYEADVTCMHYIASCQYEINQFYLQSKTLFDAIKYAEKKLGRTAKRYHIHGINLQNYGRRLKQRGDVREALPYFEKALKVYESARDFDDEDDRKKKKVSAEKLAKETREIVRLLDEQEEKKNLDL